MRKVDQNDSIIIWECDYSDFLPWDHRRNADKGDKIFIAWISLDWCQTWKTEPFCCYYNCATTLIQMSFQGVTILIQAKKQEVECKESVHNDINPKVDMLHHSLTLMTTISLLPSAGKRKWSVCALLWLKLYKLNWVQMLQSLDDYSDQPWCQLLDRKWGNVHKTSACSILKHLWVCKDPSKPACNLN